MLGVNFPPEITQTLVAALLAAGVAWVVNGLMIPALGNRGISFLTPLVEETAKTLAAIGVGGNLLWTHVAFGFIEALLEIRRRGAGGLVVGWFALAGHSIFGLITLWLYSRYGLLPALLTVYMIHASWNMGVVAHRRRSKGRLDES